MIAMTAVSRHATANLIFDPDGLIETLALKNFIYNLPKMSLSFPFRR
jgi:hypothetical protein